MKSFKEMAGVVIAEGKTNKSTVKGTDINIITKEGEMVKGPMGMEQEYINEFYYEKNLVAITKGSERGITCTLKDEDSLGYLLNELFIV